MKVAGIVCEFNPYHKGHKYLIDQLRADLNPDAIVCVMSGDFMQRGFPAMWNKYERANLAVNQGVDLVIELPTCYAVSAAPNFAKGGISILRKLGCITDLVFGSECGDIKALESAVDIENEEGFSDKLQQYMDEGLSYPSAYSKAADNPIFNEPNNTLGIEYLRENNKQKAKFKCHTIKRFFGVSAEQIRKGIIERASVRADYPDIDWDFQADERLFAMVRYMLLTTPAEELENILEASEGIENKLKKSVLEAKNFDELIQITKSKRFTYAKISRILIQMLLGITKTNFDEEQNTVKVLAFNEKGQNILKKAKSKGTLSFGPSEFDSHAHDVYNILIGKDIYSNSDYVINPKPIKN